MRYNNQMGNKKSSINRKRYSQISLKKRQTLVTSVIEAGESLTRVTKRLKIKLSTAKLILKKFRKTGVLFNKRLRNAKKQPKPRLTRPLGEQSYPIIPIIEKPNYKAPTQEQNINVFPEVNQNYQQTLPLPNTLLQSQWVWPWSGFYFFT